MSRRRTRNRNKPQFAIQGNNVLQLDEARTTRKPASVSSPATKRGTKANRSLSMAWDETEALGIPNSAARQDLMSDYDRKDTLYMAYKGNVWISSPIDVIAKRITSGGYAIEKIHQDSPDNKAEYDAIEALLLYVNDDEDFLQLIRATITDLCIFGECYWEILYKGGKPAALHKIDCMTMSYHLDKHGQVISYQQAMGRSNETVDFQPEEIIRWWFPDPRASKKALSPIERILNSVDLDGKMQDWGRNFFRKGARPGFWVELAEDSDIEEAKRFITWFRENYTGVQNAHVPPVMYNGGKLHEFGKGAIELDFLKSRGMSREESLAGFLVPPATVGVIETAHLGSGTGESQDKQLQFNACDPIKQMLFEKFNYKITSKFGKTYRVTSRYADYRPDSDVVRVEDARIRNGTRTINEMRQEDGKLPIDGGDTSFVIAGREIQPVEVLEDLADNARRTNEMQMEQQAVTLDMAKTRAEQLKNPPQQPLPMQQGQPKQQPGQQPPQLQKAQAAVQQLPPQSKKKESLAEYNDNHDAHGRFAAGGGGSDSGGSGGSGGGGSGKNAGGYVQGKPLTPQETAHGPVGAALLSKDAMQEYAGKTCTGDLAMGSMIHAQGFDGAPQVISKEAMDAHMAAGGTEFYRGISGKTPGEAQGYANEFRSGKLFVGEGNMGQGIYVSRSGDEGGGADTALRYAGEGGAVLRMSLKSDARVMSFEQYKSGIASSRVEYSAYLAELKTSGNPSYARALALENEYDAPSFYAAMRGYDAIEIGSDSHLVAIVNRTAVLVQE